MFRLQVKGHFDSAHYIRDHSGKCKNKHGHRWEVEAVVEGSALDSLNMVVDFACVKDALGSLCGMVDHNELNYIFKEPNLTAEYLAKWFFDRMKADLARSFARSLHTELRLARITIWENPDCCIKYFEETHA